MAQFGRVRGLGPWGRGFESLHPDDEKTGMKIPVFFIFSQKRGLKMNKTTLSKEAAVLLLALYQHHLKQQSFFARLKQRLTKSTPILNIDTLSLAQRKTACKELSNLGYITLQTEHHLYGEICLTEQGIEYAKTNL